MNESSEALDRLLGDWAASREASEEHTRLLADQILAAAREDADVVNVGRTKSAQSRQEANVTELPERRKALVRPTGDWGAQLMIGGGVLLLLLVLAGSVLYYNLTTVPPGSTGPARPVAVSTGSIPPVAIAASDTPAAASLDATALAAKRQLLAETNALFDDQLAWIADGEREVSFEVSDRAVPASDQFMLVRIVVARRAAPEAAWSTVWQTDVISRSESLVEVAPQQLDGSSLALWTYAMPDGEVAVDMDLMLDQQALVHSSSSAVLSAGRPKRVSCSTADGVEQCVFQTVMPLDSSHL